MKIEKVELQIMTSSEGKWLTQVDENTPINSRVLAKKVYLGINDDADNYIEISDEIKCEYERSKEAFERQLNADKDEPENKSLKDEK